MSEHAYRDEAATCRMLADEFQDRPERYFLLKAASVFELLADEAASAT